MVEGLLAIIAGAETTAAAATNALYFLIKWPETKNRLQKEIHDALSAYNGDVDYTKFMDLPYLNACMWVIFWDSFFLIGISDAMSYFKQRDI